MFNVPKSWDEVFLDQYQEIIKINETDSPFFIKQMNTLSILTDTLVDDDVWEDMDIEEMAIITKGLSWLKQDPSDQFKQVIDKYTIKDINTLTLGEFIDLEFFFSENYIDNLPKICAILYRQNKLDEWGNIVVEPYSVIVLNDRAKTFESLPINNIYGIIKYYLDFKEKIIETYVNIFEPTIEYDETEVVEYDEDEKIEIEKEETMTKWSWEHILNGLSDGDITKYDEITNLPLIFILNQLSFRKEMKL